MAKYRPYTALTRRPIGGGQGPPPSARLRKYFAGQEQQAEREQLQFKAGLATQTAIQAEGRAEERAIRTKGREAFRSKYGGGLDLEALPFGETKEHFEVQQEKITSGELGFTSPTLQRRWDTLEQERSMIQWDPRISEDDKRLKLEAIEEGMRPLIKMAKPTREARDKRRAERAEELGRIVAAGAQWNPRTEMFEAFELGGVEDPGEAEQAKLEEEEKRRTAQIATYYSEYEKARKFLKDEGGELGKEPTGEEIRRQLHKMRQQMTPVSPEESFEEALTPAPEDPLTTEAIQAALAGDTEAQAELEARGISWRD